MKKLMICLPFFLIFFWASTDFAAVYIEDFEDGSLDPPFRQDGKSYEINDGIFHMIEGTDYPGVGLQGANVGIPVEYELIYQFEADIYVSSVIDQNVGLYVSLFEPSGHDWAITLYIEKAPELSFTASLSKDGNIIGYPVLGPANHNQWYYLSITLHDDYISMSIDNNQIDLFAGLFQKPSSILSSGGDVKGQVPIPKDLDFYIDSIIAHTSIICECDFEPAEGDGDIDGSDLATYAAGGTGISLADFAAEFGRTDCL